MGAPKAHARSSGCNYAALAGRLSNELKPTGWRRWLPEFENSATQGWKFPWKSRPPNQRFRNSSRLADHAEQVEEQVRRMVMLGVVTPLTAEQAADPREAAVISPLIVVIKTRLGVVKVRICLDLSRSVNHYLEEVPCSYPTVGQAAADMTPTTEMHLIDLSDYFWSFPLHPSDRPMCCFAWRWTVFRYNALPMGAACVPGLVQQVSDAIANLVSREEPTVRTQCLLDDFLQCGEGEELDRAHALLRKIFGDLGFRINERKSTQKREQQVIYLGVLVDTERMLLMITEDRIEELTQLIEQSLQMRYVLEEI